MARGLNRATIIGFAESTPELRYTPTGVAVTSLIVSTSRRWTTNAGQERESTEWFHIVAWGSLAESARKWVTEGQRIYAEGYLQTRSWADNNGVTHYRTEIVASMLIPMDSRASVAQELLDEESEEMPLCLNRVIVIGNLGRDPEMRYTPGGQTITSFSLATTRTWIPSASEEQRDATEWFNVVAWGSLADICNQYLTKGRRVYIEGELRTRGWELPDGAKHYRTELVASEMIILGPRQPAHGAETAPQMQNHELPH